MSSPTPPFPPPGARPPAPPAPLPPSAPPPGHGITTPPPAAPAPTAPWTTGAAFRPGAIPLRPLTLGAMYDGAFRIIRYNPKATVGAAALVTSVAMLFPLIVSVVVESTVGTGLTASGDVPATMSDEQVIGLLASVGSLVLGMLGAQLGLIFVTGMVAQVTRGAAVGRRMGLGEAWAETHGVRWRLIGLTLLVGIGMTLAIAALVTPIALIVWVTGDPLLTVLAVVVGVVALVVGGPLLWIRLVYLASVTLVLERRGVFAALARSWRLSGGHFWRTLGIALLTALITSLAGGILTTPLTFGGQFAALLVPQYLFAILIGTQALALVVQNAFVAPFASAVTAVQYLDLRIRKEGYDVELMREAGVLPR